jgi:apolipoprotein N-acyltransferase
LQLAISLALLIVAGASQAAAIATPWDGQPAGWLQLLSMVVFAWQLDATERASRAALIGWVFATSWLAGTFWWLFVAMHTYAGLDAWMAALAVLVLASLLALYYAAAAALFVLCAPASRVGAAAVFASLWMLAELARGVWFTGFGWGAIGYAHIEHLARSASYVGAYGVAALVAGIAFLTMAAVRQQHRTYRTGYLALAAGLAAMMVWSPGGFTTSTGSIKVALLQGNIAQDEKFQAGSGVPDALRWYGEQLAIPHAPLTVAPETAIPLLPQQLPAGYWDALLGRIRQEGRAVLLGLPLGSEAAGYTNSVLGIQSAGPEAMTARNYRYDKHHLVPFGEFIPPMFRWFTEMMAIPLGDFSRGGVGQPSFAWQGQRLAPNICYEDLFGEELGARFIDRASAPTIFVNVSNIGWFGNTVAIDQHLNISRMRSLEFGRPFIRATNTGDTAIIDHTGRVTHSLARLTRGVLVGEVEGREGTTPFAWWVARLGLWPLWLMGAGVVAAACLIRKRGV